MPTREQRRTLDVVRAGLLALGYAQDLVLAEYGFQDYFDPGLPIRQAPLASFAQRPTSYDSACVVAMYANGLSGTELIAAYRGLGASIAFEVDDEVVNVWRVSAHPTVQDRQLTVRSADIGRTIAEHPGWAPAALMRAKNISTLDLPDAQMDFVDLGLIPALEEQIQRKLHPLLGDVLEHAQLLTDKRVAEWEQTMFRVVFWLLAGKVLHDRAIDGFADFGLGSDPQVVLRSVALYYGKRAPAPLREDALRKTYAALWSGLDFRNLSVEVLAFVYENTLVDDELRRTNAIHATPPSVARYIARHLPFESFAADHRMTIEPCCGHSTFLVAALQRMRMLLPSEWTPETRHEYFARMLQGFDIDAFSLEVSQLSLTLADFPNHNGWKLERRDVFASTTFDNALRDSRIAICNPPFSDFTAAERDHYRPRSVHKPGELLLRVLEQLHPTGVLGFVMPLQVLDGRGYRDVRLALAKRFGAIHVVSLPDRAFTTAEQETAIVIATEPRSASTAVSLSHGKVPERYWPTFKARGNPEAVHSDVRSIDEAARSLWVPALGEVWRRTSTGPRLEGIATLHRGIEWKVGQLTAHPERSVSQKPRPHFAEGVHGVSLCLFEAPDTVYLSLEPSTLKKGIAHHLPWDKPKVIMNAKRTSRGSWRIAAFADRNKLVCYQTYVCLWPSNGWSPTVLAAVLNGPLASAFVATREGNRDVTIEVLRQMPIPEISPSAQDRIEVLVVDYLRAIKRAHERADMDFEPARRALRMIDAEVLRCYALSPRLERELLDFMVGKRAVPFDFGSYYPPDFRPYVPLWRFDSEQFQRSTAARFLSEMPNTSDDNLLASLEFID